MTLQEIITAKKSAKLESPPIPIITESDAVTRLPLAVDLAKGSALLRQHLDAVVTPSGIRHYAEQAVKELVAKLDSHRAKDEETSAGKIGWLFFDMHHGIISDKDFTRQAMAIADESIPFLTASPR